MNKTSSLFNHSLLMESLFAIAKWQDQKKTNCSLKSLVFYVRMVSSSDRDSFHSLSLRNNFNTPGYPFRFVATVRKKHVDFFFSSLTLLNKSPPSLKSLTSSGRSLTSEFVVHCRCSVLERLKHLTLDPVIFVFLRRRNLKSSGKVWSVVVTN